MLPSLARNPVGTHPAGPAWPHGVLAKTRSQAPHPASHPPRALAEEEDSEIFVDIPDPEHIVIADAWPAAGDPLVEDLRSHFDARFADPLKTTSDRFV